MSVTNGLVPPANPHFHAHRNPIVRAKHTWRDLKIGDADPKRNVVCKCEKVTEAEIVDAVHRNLECASTQAVRKRTRAGMGHCTSGVGVQGGLGVFCMYV
jgi:glycerol-3-phosphate dehydrogenase